MAETRCPICIRFDDNWGRHVVPTVTALANGRRLVECKRCGRYELGTVLDELDELDEAGALALSWATRNETDQGRTAVVDATSYRQLLSAAPVIDGASAQELHMLSLIAEACGRIGERSRAIDWVAFSARSLQKARAYDYTLAELKKEGYVEVGRDGAGSNHVFRLLRKGWLRVENERPPAPQPAVRAVPAVPGSFEFDVALSFAGEQRHLAHELAGLLKQHDVRVFYDLDHEASLWGKDLGAELTKTYNKGARHVVMFVSHEYARKEWPNHEREAAVARTIKEIGGDYILPVRVDAAEIPGLSATRGYVDAGKGMAHVASLLLVKLGRAPSPVLGAEPERDEPRAGGLEEADVDDGVIEPLTADATYVLRRGCEHLLEHDVVVAFVDGGEDFLVDADPPLARDACREAIDLLEEYDYVRGSPVFGSGRKWLSFSVTTHGFDEYAHHFLDDFEARSRRIVARMVEATRDAGVFTSQIASDLDEKHVLVSLVLQDLIEQGKLKGDRMGDGGWCVYSPAPSLKVEFADSGARSAEQPPREPTPLRKTVRRVREDQARDDPGELVERLRSRLSVPSADLLDFVVEAHLEDGLPVPGTYVRDRRFEDDPAEGDRLLAELVALQLLEISGRLPPDEAYLPKLLGLLAGTVGAAAGGALLTLRDLFRQKHRSEKHPTSFEWQDLGELGYGADDFFLLLRVVHASRLHGSGTWDPEGTSFRFSMPIGAERVGRCEGLDDLLRVLGVKDPLIDEAGNGDGVPAANGEAESVDADEDPADSEAVGDAATGDIQSQGGNTVVKEKPGSEVPAPAPPADRRDLVDASAAASLAYTAGPSEKRSRTKRKGGKVSLIWEGGETESETEERHSGRTFALTIVVVVVAVAVGLVAAAFSSCGDGTKKSGQDSASPADGGVPTEHANDDARNSE
jgi:hypothetical protein